jgi:uncharacterized damage-inducible protein DinB
MPTTEPNTQQTAQQSAQPDIGRSIDWNAELIEQLDWHWKYLLRSRLVGLTDEEYRWEPVAGCWNVRPRGQSTAALALGAGDFTLDYDRSEPDPPPVTTIAWRLAHILVGVLSQRTAGHFGGPPVDYESFTYAGTADEALKQLDAAYEAWVDGVRGLGADGLKRPCGPAEGPYAEYPMATLVLHINREVIHHGAEIALLRDLYRHRPFTDSRATARAVATLGPSQR